MEAIISAGGRGTRLGSLASEIPKALLPVSGKPILQYQLEELRRSGVAKVTLLIGHLGERIEEFLASRSWGLEIVTLREEKALGTGGGLAQLKGKIDTPFFFLYGDLLLSMDFSALARAHAQRDARITLVAHPNSHPGDSDLIVEDGEGLVLDILPKNENRLGYYSNLVNAGIFALDPSVLESLESGRKIDFEKEIVRERIVRREVRSYRTTEYVKDMGTPERLAHVERDVASGIVEARRKSNRQRAIFLDRDGTINEHVGLLCETEQFRLLPQAAEAIGCINKSSYLCFVVSNQPVVARNLCGIDAVREIHRKMETELGKKGAFLDDIVFCPHHPDSGYVGENPTYKIHCDCRKPKPGMLLELARMHNVDLASSYLVGDTSSDIQTAKNAGTRSVLVRTGEGGRDGKYEAKPDFVAADLSEAVDWIFAQNA